MVESTTAGQVDDDRLLLLRIPQVAARLGCTRQTVYRLIWAGELTAVELVARGRKRKVMRVRVSDLDAYLAGMPVREPAVSA